ncbi:MAG: hypothetical protein ACREJU_06760 [Nitrospiraceae bacterium]
MAPRAKQASVQAIHARYRHATRAEQRTIVDEVTQVCGYHRTYAIGLLNRLAPPRPRPRRVSRRRPVSSEEAMSILAWIWEASGYVCAPRLKAARPVGLPWVRQRRPLLPRGEPQLLASSARQMDRRLQRRKRTRKWRLYGTTRPGTLLQPRIPIKTDHWDVRKSGYLASDLVSHSGGLGGRGLSAHRGRRGHPHGLGGAAGGQGQRPARHRAGAHPDRTAPALRLARPGFRQGKRVHHSPPAGVLPAPRRPGHPVHPLPALQEG